MQTYPVGRRFETVILSLTLRCNLACDYCHVFFMQDQSWRQAPGHMPLRVVRLAAQRIAEHIRIHGHETINIALHGGEPLLYGPRYIAAVLQILREEISLRPIDAYITVQTNGIYLTHTMLELLSLYGVGVGVSLDGDRAANDLHRLTHKGQSSYEATIRNLKVLSTQYRHIFNGILTVIDHRTNPARLYNAIAALRPPTWDVLLPHGYQPGDIPVYGNWLAELWNHWQVQTDPIPNLRFFRQIIEGFLTRKRGSDLLRQNWQTSVLIAPDGTYEQLDTMKSVKRAATAFHVDSHPLDAVRLHPDMIAQSAGVWGLCETCQACRWRDLCGGGQFVHRYKNGHHRNPSSYCRDLQIILDHARTQILALLTKER